MKKKWIFVCHVLASLSLLTACYPAAEPVRAAAPRATGTVSLPTPAPIGQRIADGNLQVEMRAAELTANYESEFGSERKAPKGINFLWIQLWLKNSGSREEKLPAPKHFSALFGTTEFKPGYGHRKNYSDYTALNPILYPGQEVEAWLRFELPTAASLETLQLVFLPESYQISTAFSPGEYPWGEHPIYFWKCAP